MWWQFFQQCWTLRSAKWRVPTWCQSLPTWLGGRWPACRRSSFSGSTAWTCCWCAHFGKGKAACAYFAGCWWAWRRMVWLQIRAVCVVWSLEWRSSRFYLEIRCKELWVTILWNVCWNFHHVNPRCGLVVQLRACVSMNVCEIGEDICMRFRFQSPPQRTFRIP